MRRVTFSCPLCLEVGRIGALVAELEPAPPLLTVVGLQGRCVHAAAFGELAQPLEEAWTLTEAALEAADGEGRARRAGLTGPRLDKPTAHSD
jgi:xanthosine utilization system XapX-like protein